VIVTTGTFLRGLMHTGRNKPRAAGLAKPPPRDYPHVSQNWALNLAG